MIFAFGGCALLATSLLRGAAHLPHPAVSAGPWPPFTFWGWQLVIVLAAITLPLGCTNGKEYAELEWPIDILIAVVWVVLRRRLLRHHRQAHRSAHLRGQLVLRRLHPGRGAAAHRQQRGRSRSA